MGQPLFIQTPQLIYLTGINQYDIALILDPFAETEKEMLFLPVLDPKKEFFEGAQLSSEETSLAQTKQLTGFEHIYSSSLFLEKISKKCSKHNSTIFTMYYEHFDKKDNVNHFFNDFKETLSNFLIQKKQKVALESLASWDQNRLIFDEIDRKNMSVAQKKTHDGFLTICDSFHDHQTEKSLSAALKAELLKQSWQGESFPTIVASSKNAETLHYTTAHCAIEKEQLILLDFGLRWGALCTDISRTLPASGVFNPLQKLLYSIVLSAQLHVMALVKEGVTLNELNAACWDFIEDALTVQFFSIGGTCHRKYDKSPHNVGHLIAHSVHDGDPTRAYRTMPLRSGMMITIEPGLYGVFECEIDGTHYREHCGIRIEDNVMVTKSGVHNMTSIPKTIEEIESLLKIN